MDLPGIPDTANAPGAPEGGAWYFMDGPARRGPITWPWLVKLAREGQLSPDQLVWHEGLDHWRPARAVAGLFEHP